MRRIITNTFKPDRNLFKIILAATVSTFALFLIVTCIFFSLLRGRKGVPFNGLRLVYWHSFQERRKSTWSNFVALEIDDFFLVGQRCWMRAILISNSGFSKQTGLIDLGSRELVEFKGKRSRGMYLVYWLNSGPISPVDIYNLRFRPLGVTTRKYLSKPLNCYHLRAQQTRTKNGETREEFDIYYNVASLLELETENHGAGRNERYDEFYYLIYDNSGILGS